VTQCSLPARAAQIQARRSAPPRAVRSVAWCRFLPAGSATPQKESWATWIRHPVAEFSPGCAGRVALTGAGEDCRCASGISPASHRFAFFAQLGPLRLRSARRSKFMLAPQASPPPEYALCSPTRCTSAFRPGPRPGHRRSRIERVSSNTSFDRRTDRIGVHRHQWRFHVALGPAQSVNAHFATAHAVGEQSRPASKHTSLAGAQRAGPWPSASTGSTPDDLHLGPDALDIGAMPADQAHRRRTAT